jgi:Na+/H+-dicarboxylate symporter
MDMARTSLNVVGNCLATVLLARWEGDFELTPEPPLQADAPTLRLVEVATAELTNG